VRARYRPLLAAFRGVMKRIDLESPPRVAHDRTVFGERAVKRLSRGADGGEGEEYE